MVEITYLAIGAIALVAMFFGYGFGLFEGRSQGYKKRKKEEATEKKDAPVVEVPQPAPEPVKIKVDDPGLLRIKNEQGYVTLDLDGARVDTTALTTDQRKRLIEMLGLMRPWLEGKPVPAPIKSPATETPPVSQVQSARNLPTACSSETADHCQGGPPDCPGREHCHADRYDPAGTYGGHTSRRAVSS